MDHNENSKDAVSCGALTKSLSGYYAKIFLDKEHTALARASLSGKNLWLFEFKMRNERRMDA